uniref:KRAB domain-containing protein n=1 Tax=Ornithorhynchus anatinus TaxID=9258 RepID=A0A6I8NAM5_ORNAN
MEVTFEDVAIFLTRREWESLVDAQRELYKTVMLENYGHLGHGFESRHCHLSAG